MTYIHHDWQGDTDFFPLTLNIDRVQAALQYKPRGRSSKAKALSDI